MDCHFCGGEVRETEREVTQAPVGVFGRMTEFTEASGRCSRCGMKHVWIVKIECLDNRPFGPFVQGGD
jgi:hypothetical protein